MDPTSFQMIATGTDLAIKAIALIIGGAWALYKIGEYRELKRWVQLDIDAHLYRLGSEALPGKSYSWNEDGHRTDITAEDAKAADKHYTHAVEVLLTFTNKGKTRCRLYNIQLGINTMREPGDTKLNEDDGHLSLRRLFTSGNIVPKFVTRGRPVEETSFYYIEPGVQQTITYLALIPTPRDLVQVVAEFSLEQRRIFPTKKVGPTGLFPHTAARTFQLDPESQLFKR